MKKTIGKNIDVEVEYIIRDRNGKIKKKHKEKSDSLLANFLRIVRTAITGASESLIDRLGNLFTLTDTEIQNIKIDAPEGNDDYGILAGRGTSEVYPNDYNLSSPIGHGDGDGLLHYYGTGFSDITVDNATKESKFEVYRDFKNNGSIDITINEIGLAIELEPHDILIFRHVFENPPTLKTYEYITLMVRIKIIS